MNYTYGYIKKWIVNFTRNNVRLLLINKMYEGSLHFNK